MILFTGNLNELIEIERLVEGKNNLRTPTKTWVKIGEIDAEIRYNTGTQSWQNTPQQNVHLSTQTFVFRFMEGIDYKIRILHRGSYFYPLSIETLHRKHGYSIIAERRENG
jgi:head-tail adaptor